MKKIIVFASALALAGGASYAMEEDGMDKDMMMEAPAPSVTVTGSGEMGFENVDSGNDATDGIKLIRAYKVAFSSSSTTDGGLVFGAGISIRDDTGETDAHGHDDDNKAKGVQGPAVKGSHVYVGAADGSWKLQFGGNDPGIDLAGGIGVADDNFGGEDDESIALSGSIEGATYRITMANPSTTGAGDGDWSIGASYSISDISVGVGMDSESGLAIGVGTELAGLSTKLYYSKAEAMVDSVDTVTYPGIDAMPEVRFTRFEQYYVNQGKALAAWAGTTEGKAALGTTLADADAEATRLENVKLFNSVKKDLDDGMKVTLTADENTALDTFIVDPTDDDATDVDESTLSALAETALDNGVLVASELGAAALPLVENVDVKESGSAAIDADTTVQAGTREYTGFGGKVSVPAGEGTSFSIAYSTFKADTMPEDIDNFRDEKGTTVTPYGGGSVKTTLIELGVSYDLGGGATLGAGIDKKSVESITISTNDDNERVGKVDTDDTTTLSASLAFSF